MVLQIVARPLLIPLSCAGFATWYGAYEVTDKSCRLVLNLSPKKLTDANKNAGFAVAGFTAIALPYFRQMFFPPPSTVYAEPPKGSNIIVTMFKRQVAYVRQFPVIYYGRSFVASAVVASISQRVYNKTHEYAT